LRHSSKPPPSAGPVEASTEDSPAESTSIEANEAYNSSSDLKFLNQVVIFKICTL